MFCPPLLCPTSHFTDKATAFVTLPSDRKSESFDLFYNSQFCPTFGHAVQKGLSRVQKAWFCPRESWDIHRDRRAVTYLVFVMCTTMMGKPDSGMDRGELRSTLSRAGSCRSSANNINEERPDSHTWPATERGNNGVLMERQEQK